MCLHPENVPVTKKSTFRKRHLRVKTRHNDFFTHNKDKSNIVLLKYRRLHGHYPLCFRELVKSDLLAFHQRLKSTISITSYCLHRHKINQRHFFTPWVCNWSLLSSTVICICCYGWKFSTVLSVIRA